MVPVTQLDAYMEAVLWTGRRGVLSHETALDLHELCDVNPSAIHLMVPSGFRTRKAVPAIYRLHRFDLDPAEIGWHEGIPIVTPERAILGGIEQALGWQLIDQAIETARARGLITKAGRRPAGRYAPPAAGGSRWLTTSRSCRATSATCSGLSATMPLTEACRRRGCSGG